jgi:hypothetical protein
MNAPDPIAARTTGIHPTQTTTDLNAPSEGPTMTGERPRSVDRSAMAVGFVLTAVFDVGLALVAFHIAKRMGANDQIAYLVAGIGPLTMMLITWIRAKTLSGASVVILLILLLSCAAAFIGGADSRLLIVKDSAVTAGFGLACLVSLFFPKPLMFYFGAKFATDGTKDGLRYWSGLWRYPNFRKSQYLINNVWGIGFLIEAALRIVVAYTTASFQLANTVSTILPLVFFAGLITYTIRVGKRARAAAADRIPTSIPTAEPTKNSEPVT